MAAAQNTAAVRRLYEEAFNDGNLAIVDEVLAPRHKEHQYGINPPGAEGLKNTIAMLRGAFPNFSCTIEHLAEDGDKVWAHVKVRGTHEHEFMGFAPTHKPFEIDVFHLCRVERGKIVEHWGVPDRAGVMEQLGLAPRSQAVDAR